MLKTYILNQCRVRDIFILTIYNIQHLKNNVLWLNEFAELPNAWHGSVCNSFKNIIKDTNWKKYSYGQKDIRSCLLITRCDWHINIALQELVCNIYFYIFFVMYVIPYRDKILFGCAFCSDGKVSFFFFSLGFKLRRNGCT